MEKTEGYVYLICDPLTDHYKIGVTKGKVDNRLFKLQTGNSTELHVVQYYKTQYPFRMEKMLHLKYKNLNTHGEWFELPSYDVINFKLICEKIEKDIEALKDNPFFKKGLKE